MKIEIDVDAAVQRSNDKLRQIQARQQVREQRQVDALKARHEFEISRQGDEIREIAPRLQAILNREEPPYLIGRWLLFDNWTVQQGLLLLVGLEPATDAEVARRMESADWRSLKAREAFNELEALYTLRGLRLWEDYSSIVPEWRSIRLEILSECQRDLRELRLVWDSGDHPAKASPQYFIDWAARKNIHVSWKDYAIEKGLIYDDRPPTPVPSLSAAAEIGDGERATLLKQIASLAMVIAERAGKYRRGDRPNASALAQAIDEVVSAIPDANRHGLSSSSIRENIKAGIELIAK